MAVYNPVRSRRRFVHGMPNSTDASSISDTEAQATMVPLGHTFQWTMVSSISRPKATALSSEPERMATYSAQVRCTISNEAGSKSAAAEFRSGPGRVDACTSLGLSATDDPVRGSCSWAHEANSTVAIRTNCSVARMTHGSVHPRLCRTTSRSFELRRL
jgi:hypothetical protein